MTQVNICSCLLNKFPGLQIVKDWQMDPDLEHEERRAVFVVVNKDFKPWSDNCPCVWAVVHIREPINAAPHEHGEAATAAEGRHIRFFHMPSGQNALLTAKDITTGDVKLEHLEKLLGNEPF